MLKNQSVIKSTNSSHAQLTSLLGLLLLALLCTVSAYGQVLYGSLTGCASGWPAEGGASQRKCHRDDGSTAPANGSSRLAYGFERGGDQIAAGDFFGRKELPGALQDYSWSKLAYGEQFSRRKPAARHDLQRQRPILSRKQHSH